MKKLFIIALAMMMFVLVGCDKTTTKTDDDVLDNDTDIVVDDTEDPDNDSDNPEDPDDPVVCTLDSEWMQPEDGWSSWAYLKMMGPIGDYDGEYAAAVFTDGKIKLSSGTTDFADGSYMNYQSQILLADAAAYEFTDVDQGAGTAVVDYWDAMYQFSLQLIPLMKEEGATEGGFGATVTFRHTYIDVEFDASGSVTSQEVRKNCYLAVSNTEEMEEEGETYDVPIGNIFGCFGDNTDGSVGEDLKMMFKNDMTEDQTALLEFFNTQTDGTVLAYGDEGFQHLCMCYEADGTEVDCWAYDGPGGAEECPDYVSAEDCKVPVTDETTDEVADEMTDEVVVDEMADEVVVSDADAA